MRRLATLTAAFSGGIVLAQYVLPLRWLLPLAVLAFFAALAGLLCRRPWGRRVLLAGVGISLALGYHWLYVRQAAQPMERLADTAGTVTMTLRDVPASTAYGARATVSVEGLPGLAVYYGDAALLDHRPGETVTGTVYFQSASRIRDDDVTTFTSRNVYLLAYGRGAMAYGSGSANGLRWLPARLGQTLRAQIDLRFGEDAGVVRAILTGDKSGVARQTALALSEAGLYHILAVSGMHCMFLLTMVTALLGRHRRRLIAAWALPLLTVYALLVGGTPSVVRACVMLAFYLAAPLFGRESDGPTALFTALAGILLVNPFAAASVSLQLSFGAMAGILFLTPRLRTLLLGEKKHGRAFTFTASGISATFGALVFTAPLAGLYFNTLVLLSPLSNLLCLWAASGLFMSALAAVMLGCLCPPLGAAAAWVPRAFLWYLLHAAGVLAKVPYHAVYFSNPYLKYWLGFVYVLFAAAYCLRPAARRKYALAAGASVLTLAMTVQLGVWRYGGAALHAMVLDVGQGSAALLASHGQFALVDCGSANSWYDPGQIAADQLMSMGCRRLDYLVLTHYDADHVNGVETLLDRLPVAALLVPDAGEGAELRDRVLAAAEAHGTEIHFVTAAETLALGVGTLTLYPPLGGAGDNERGLTALTTAGDFDLLITGDMDRATEKRLLETDTLPDIEALVVGHHGAKTSTSEELLAALTPERAIISVGANSYGHPTVEALRRLALAGADISRTDLQGTIHLTVN